MSWGGKKWRLLFSITIFLIAASLVVCKIFTEDVRDKDPASLYFTTKGGNHNRQCSLPILYTFNQDLSSDAKDIFIDAFNYWNELSDSILFLGIGDYEHDAGTNITSSFVIIDIEEKSKYYKSNDGIKAAKDVAAITLFKYEENGCMLGTGIVIFQDTLGKYNREELETIARHEIGHVLGFHHSDKKEDLMHPTTALKFNQKHPKKLSKWEIEAFTMYYK